MKVNRVTLSAFGTTGVLLAASLTMLAIVSALVTFDAWPTRAGSASASDVAIQRAPAVRVVRAVRRSAAATAAAAATRSGAKAAGSALAGASGGASGGSAVASHSAGTYGGSPVSSGPPPVVPAFPPGEGDPGPGPVAPAPPPPDTVHTVVNDATSAVCGVAAVGC
jgi:hypothetical protein